MQRQRGFTVLRGFYFYVDDLERLYAYSDQTGMSKSEIVREALREKLDEMEETGEVSPIKKKG